VSSNSRVPHPPVLPRKRPRSRLLLLLLLLVLLLPILPCNDNNNPVNGRALRACRREKSSNRLPPVPRRKKSSR
jgi:hypothetical protein